MKANITARRVAGMKPGESIADSEVRGLLARCLPSGAVTFGYRYRDAEGKRHYLAIGVLGVDGMTIDKAQAAAKKRAAHVAGGGRPVPPSRGPSLNDVLDRYIDRRVAKFRTARQVTSMFDRLVRPALGDKRIADIRRGDVVDLIDEVEDGSGPVMADRMAAYLRTLFYWHAERDEDFIPPLIKVKPRAGSTRQRARDRVLDDQEIRDLWATLDTMAATVRGRHAGYHKAVKVMLLTGQRCGNVAKMAAEQIKGDQWIIPKEQFKTGVEQVVPLTPAIKALLVRDGLEGKRNYVLTFDDQSARRIKGELDAYRKQHGRPPMPDWRIHDLRRTARSLMSRAGVRPDVADRVLGHAVPGMRATYDRHSYWPEKLDALERLAALLDDILAGGKVVKLRKRKVA